MKKIFATLLTCILIVTAILFIRSEKFAEFIVKDIAIEDIQINDIGLKNNTYYYEKLDDKQKKYYRQIGNSIMNLDEDITIEVTNEKNYDLFKNNVEIALMSFLNDHPEVFYIDDEYEISLTDFIVIKILKLKLNYSSNDKKEIVKMEEELEKQVRIISEKAKSYTSTYDKELFIHDYIATNVDYYNYENYENIPTIKHTAYGALVEGSAVCDGITKAFQLILNQNSIENIFVTGTTENIAHAWTKVKIDNDYYNVDLTSDKTLNKENKELVFHSYFNVTDEEILKTHTIDGNERLPQCTATKYNYYVYNDYQIGYMDSFEYKLGEIIEKQNSSPLLEINVNGISDVPDKLITALYNLNFNNFKTNNITKVQYHKINNNYIIIK